MNDVRSTSRWLAAILLSQIAISPIANFTLLKDATQAAGGFLVNAAAHGNSLAAGALLSLALTVFTAGIAVALWPVLRERSERMAVSLAVLGGVGIALAGLEHMGLLSMLSLSQGYAAAGSPDGALYEALRDLVRAQRNWAHLIRLLAGGGLLLLMYSALYRFLLVPRWLAGFGALASALQMFAVAQPHFGGWVTFPLLAPLGVANLLLAGWLVVKGLRQASQMPASTATA